MGVCHDKIGRRCDNVLMKCSASPTLKFRDPCNNVTATFYSADHGCLIDDARLTFALAPLALMPIAALAADVGFVNLDDAD